jgi:PAS domain S-box-containing protein
MNGGANSAKRVSEWNVAFPLELLRASPMNKMCRQSGSAEIPVRVLVADHEPMWREYASTRLQSQGLEPVVVVNGERAWSVLQERDAPRLVIIDQRIPQLNALEICRRLRVRADAFYTYIMVLMTVSHRGEELLCLQSGADDCLAKPYNQDDFTARLAIAQRVLAIDMRLSAINRRWRILVDNMPFGVAAVDVNGRLKRMNTTFARQMGYSDVKELLGQPLRWVIQRQTDVRGLLDEVRWGEQFDEVEVVCHGVKGKPRVLRLWGRPLVDSDEAAYEIVVKEN